MTDFKPLIDQLEIEIEKVIDQHGMENDIDALYEKWAYLMYCYGTQYRGKEDDKEVIKMATNIYNELQSITRKYDNVNNKHYDAQPTPIAMSGVNVTMRKNLIMVDGTDDELEQVRHDMKETFNVDGRYMDGGLMYYKKHSRKLLHLGYVNKDLNASDDSVSQKRKRDNQVDFYIKDNKIFFVKDVNVILRYNGIPYDVFTKSVDIIHYDQIVASGILGNAVSPESNAMLFKVYRYKSDDVLIIAGYHKNIKKIGYNTDIDMDDNEIDIVLVDTTTVKSLDLSIESKPFPVAMYSTLWERYPSLKPLTNDFLDHTSIEDWYEFRGSNVYIFPWQVKQQQRYNIAADNSISHQSSVYHIAVKRMSKRIRDMTSQLIPTNSRNIFLTKHFLTQLYVAMEKNIPFITFLTHEFSATCRHMNALYIDTRKRIIIRYEPHGKSLRPYSNEKCDRDILNVISNNTTLKLFKYYGPSTFQAVSGPQSREEWNQNKYEIKKMKFGTKEKVVQAIGFCVAWSVMFQHFAILNYDSDPRDIHVELVGENIDVNILADRIRIFQSYLVKLSKEYFGKTYESPFPNK